MEVRVLLTFGASLAEEEKGRHAPQTALTAQVLLKGGRTLDALAVASGVAFDKCLGLDETGGTGW